jgi:hypothetical protein
MKQNTLFAITLLLAGGAVSWAQGTRGPHNQGPLHAASSYLNMSKLQTVAGTVTNVDVAFGMQYPSITVNQQMIKLAPAWYLLDHKFEIKAGDPVSVLAAPSARANDSYFYAVEITRTNTRTTLTLRDSSGVPLWSGGNGGQTSNAGSNGAGCLDPATVRTVTGTVDRVSMGAGIQMPYLVLKTADGTLIGMKIGPQRILLEADFELKPGEPVTVKFAHETCADENVALELTNAAGVTVTLR